jgi:molecular chaperone DnaK
VNEAGFPEIIPNAEGEKTTPSIVLFDRDQAVIGSATREALRTDPGSVVQLARRHMGSARTFNVHGMELRPEQISALILRKMVQDAAALIGPIGRAVITVPAYADASMRTATKRAGEMAGLEVMAVLNEPTAIAIAFGVQARRQNAAIVVCHVGGAGFNVDVLDVNAGRLALRATGGDNFLGGANFDKVIFDYFVERFKGKHGIDLVDPQQLDLDELVRVPQDWLRKAEQIKRDLTIKPQASTTLDLRGKTLRVGVNREELERMARVLLQEIEEKIRDTRDEARLEAGDVDMVLLSGGPTHMPMIRTLVERIFDRQPNTSVNPDEVIARGAALWAHILTTR